MYTAVKYIHLFAIVCSVSLFIVSYFLMMANSDVRNKAFLKRVPRLLDSIMLLSGISLILITGVVPFTGSAPWLTEKLTCVMVYIVLAFVALNHGNNKVVKTFAFLGALGWLMVAYNITMSKVSTFLG